MIRFFLRHPTAANLLMALFLVMGLTALPGLKRQTFPDFLPEEVTVTVAYPGATARDIEEAVNGRIEEALNPVRHIREIRSEARDNVGTVTVEMVPGNNPSAFLDDIRTEVEAIDDLPEETEDPVIRLLRQTTHVVSLAVTGPMEPHVLKAYAESLKRELKALPEVSQVKVEGFSDHQFQVLASLPRLRQHGMTVAELARAVGDQNVDLPAGALRSLRQETTLRFDDERRSVEGLEDLVVREGAAGGRVLLGDVAEVKDTFEDDEDKILFDGRRAAVLNISKTDDQDMLRVFDAVEAFMVGKRRTAPPGVRFDLTHDMTSIVRDRLQLLIKNGIQGFVLVFLALVLFFNLRFSLWVSMGLPVSFLGALFLFPVLDQTLNMITMVALLMGIGLLMDDAIVISENIAAHLTRGKSPFQAALDGIKEIRAGVLSSFATTAVVFLPLMSVEGQIGRVLKSIPVILLVVLSISLIEAFLILPHHLAQSLKGARNTPTRRQQATERAMTFLRDRILGPAVDCTVKWRYMTLGVTLLLFLASMSLIAGGRVKSQAFPDIDGDILEARLLLPGGTPLEETELRVKRLMEALDGVNEEFRPDQPGGSDLILHRTVQYGVHKGLGEKGPQAVTLRADLLHAEERNALLDDVARSWREKTGELPDAVSLSFTEPSLGPQGKAIDIRLLGNDLDELHRASTELQEWLKGYPAATDVVDDLKPGKPEIRIRPRPGTSSLGLSASDLASQIRTAFHGGEADTFQVGTESYEVSVRLAEDERRSLADLRNFPVRVGNSGPIPLGSVTELTADRFWSRISRTDGIRTVSVTGDVDTRKGNTAEILRQVKKQFLPGLMARHPGVRMLMEGESSETAETQSSMLRALLFGVLGIFVLLSFQFRSYVEPLVVLVAIPFAFIGVILGNFLMGHSLSMPGIMGFVSLAGVVVNNSILLMEFIRLGMERGQPLVDAARSASRERFRAMLLTSLTTIAGMTPLLFERSLQAQVLIPLAVSVVFGLLASTLLVLLVLPALYTILDDLGRIRQTSEFASPTPTEGQDRRPPLTGA